MSPIRFAALFLLGATLAAAQCPAVHVFGARETTVPPGFGTAGPVVNSIVSAFPGATSEAINYPACGGQASCGGVSYASSVVQGVAAVASQVNAFNQQCPNSVLVLVGYSQVLSTFHLYLSTCLLTQICDRVVKSLTMLTAEEAIPTKVSATLPFPSPQLLKPRSPRPSSWVTRVTSLACPTMSEPAKQVAWVPNISQPWVWS